LTTPRKSDSLPGNATLTPAECRVPFFREAISMGSFVSFLSGIWVYVIYFCAILNVVAWFYLVLTAGQSSKQMFAWLQNLVGPFSRRRDVQPAAHQLDSIDAFLADVRDVVEQPEDEAELRSLQQRITIKGESRPHGLSHMFEQIYGLCRASIEAFPLLGILGTVLAIAAGMQATSDGQTASQITQVVKNFGESVYCTAWGILFAIVFSFVNGWYEPDFHRVIGQTHMLEDLVLAVKKKVGLATE
jgi:biopolymer transport protein ExbB